MFAKIFDILCVIALGRLSGGYGSTSQTSRMTTVDDDEEQEEWVPYYKRPITYDGDDDD